MCSLLTKSGLRWLIAVFFRNLKDNIKNADWRYRDAALMAFGSILEGPDAACMKPIAEQAMQMLIEAMQDESVVVKDTAAWTIGRVCELISDVAINEAYLRPLLETLVTGLSAEPRVAANVCWAFNSLAEAAMDDAVSNMESYGDTPPTYCLSNYFDVIVQKLLETTGSLLFTRYHIMLRFPTF